MLNRFKARSDSTSKLDKIGRKAFPRPSSEDRIRTKVEKINPYDQQSSTSAVRE